MLHLQMCVCVFVFVCMCVCVEALHKMVICSVENLYCMHHVACHNNILVFPSTQQFTNITNLYYLFTLVLFCFCYMLQSV
jgi:hypothetical protein